VDPAPLAPGRGPHLAHGLPEAQGAVAPIRTGMHRRPPSRRMSKWTPSSGRRMILRVDLGLPASPGEGRQDDEDDADGQ